MFTTINGFDYTSFIDFPDISLSQTANDPVPKATLIVNDAGSNFGFQIGQEVIIWNEAGAREKTFSPTQTIAATPAHNIVQLTNISGSTAGAWATTGALSLFSSFPGIFPVVSFSNTTFSGGNNYEYANAVTPPGYIHPGQQYMFSVYATIATPLVNAQAVVQMQFLDGGGNLLGSPTQTTFASTIGIANQQRIAISAVAPTSAAYVQVSFGGQATVSGSNSGTINYGTAQCEPMWFATSQNLSYPTPDCNIYQADCATMPDGTTSRAVRFFSGFVNDIQISYDGSNRQWTLSCAGSGALLESGLINGIYTNQYDSQILANVIAANFSTQLSINAANIVAPQPLTQGAYLSSISYSDNTLREVLNGLADASGYVFYIDPYYRLYYQPAFFDSATFSLTDSAPDNIMSYNYYNYTLEYDGTQMKRRIKIVGGQFTGNYPDVFSGNGSATQFTLTFIPSSAPTISVGGVAKKVGVYGRDTLGGSIDVLINTQSQFILFGTPPASGANNILATYPYQAPITTQATMPTGSIVTPAYALPYFDSKVNDTNITDLTTATTRGVAEIVKYGSPLVILTFSSSQFCPAGSSIYFSSSLDGLINVPVQIQRVTGTYLGNGINEFQYVAGTAYQPTLVDHIRNANKAINRSTVTANANAIEQNDVVATETIGYHDSISATLQTTYAIAVYGTGHYGSCAYGGHTGIYGTATYGQSTIYG